MSGLDPLAEQIAERVAALPTVTAVYPTAPYPLRLLPEDAPGHRPLVRLHDAEGVLEVLVSIGIAADVPAPAAGDSARVAVEQELDAAGVADRAITVRVATFD